MNEKIDKLIEWLNPQVTREDKIVLPPFGVESSRFYTRSEFRDEVRKILGIDKQCFQCLEYFFEHDLSVVEETGKLICQDCAEGIINGTIKVREEV